MKLPDIQYNRVAPAQINSPTGEVARARMRLDTLDAAANLGRTIAQEKVEYDAANANADYRERVVSVERDLLDKDELTIDDLKAYGVDETNPHITWTGPDGEPVTTFKKYEVETAVMSQVMDNALEDAGKNIASDSFRNSWIASTKEQNDNALMSIAQRSVKHARDYEYKELQGRLQEARLSGDWERMDELIDTSPAAKRDPDLKRSIKAEVKQGLFITSTNETIFSGSDEELDSLITDLRENRSDYPIDERTYVSTLSKAQSEKNFRERGTSKDANDYARSVLGDMKSAAAIGVPIPDMVWDKAKQDVAGTDYAESMESLEQVSMAALLPVTERAAMISDLSSRFNAGDISVGSDLKMMIESDTAIRSAASKDAISLGIQQGLLPKDYPPINFMDPESIAQRVRDAQKMSVQFGVNASPLRYGEAQMFADSMDSMSTAELVAVSSALSEAPGIWDQLSNNGQPVYAMAGATGDPNVMSVIVDGKRNLDAGNVKSPSTSDGWMEDFNEYVGNAYGVKDKADMREAALAAYASLNPGEDYSPDKFKEALDIVSGGIAEINGSKVEIPRGFAGGVDAFEDYMDNYSVVDIQGTMTGHTPERTAEVIRQSELRGTKEGPYLVIDPASGRPYERIRDDGTVEPYTLDISPDSIMRIDSYQSVRDRRR